MAIEAERGCGFRRIHGLYLVGDFIGAPCDRLPYPVGKCPYCNQGIKFPRVPTLINPAVVFGQHKDCKDAIKPCIMCDPTSEPAYLLGVGREYSVNGFVAEALARGVSKRIHQIPRHLTIGKTVIYLCHNEACDIPDDSPEKPVKSKHGETPVEPTGILSVPKTKKGLGIFAAFIPQRLEKLFWESERTDKLMAKLAKQNITPVFVPDGDIDHAPAKLRKKLLKQRAPKQLKQPLPPARDAKGHFIKTKKEG